ncbi:gamma-glutamyl-gamma-aminobutyrate hydrolase family protein [Micromonospora matsumotoense]|uniref:gamma-glutamyl-gamma-aminobutyrate hydrolase family protein n=1 Tax=Micromonospora matsumotoense TaxID=121616 RepID=UPI0033E6F056
MTTPVDLPVVGVLSCQKQRANGSTYSRVNDILVAQLARLGAVCPVLIPTVRPDLLGGTLRALDGLVLPGSGSYLHPRRCPTPDPPVPGREYDEARDEAALTLLSLAEEVPDLPVLGSCRGMQEIVVHRGGRLREIDDTGVPHRLADDGGDSRWAPAHALQVRDGGLLAQLLGPARHPEVRVNSAHSQVVTDLPDGVRVEAEAPDGLVEAVSVDWPHRFVLGFQWHFERRPQDTPLNTGIFAEFAARCRSRRRGRS